MILFNSIKRQKTKISGSQQQRKRVRRTHILHKVYSPVNFFYNLFTFKEKKRKEGGKRERQRVRESEREFVVP